MKFLVYCMALLLFSCSISKVQVEKICSFKQGFLTYENLADSSYTLKLQKLGTNYLNFWMDSCYVGSNNNLGLTGFVTYPDMKAENFQRKLSDVTIIQVLQVNKTTFKLLKVLGKTQREGRFEIEVKPYKSGLFLLINKDGYNCTLIQFLQP